MNPPEKQNILLKPKFRKTTMSTEDSIYINSAI